MTEGTAPRSSPRWPYASLLWGGLVGLLLAAAGSLVVGAAAATQASERLWQDLDRLAAEAVRASAPAEQDAFVRTAARWLNARVTWIAPDGAVRADSDVAPADVPGVESHAQRPEVVAALRGGRGEARRLSSTVGERFVYVARRLSRPDGAASASGVLRVALPERDLARTSARHRREVLVLGLAGGLLAGLAVAVARRRHERTVQLLTEALESMAEGAEAPTQPWDPELTGIRRRLTAVAERATRSGREDERVRLISRVVFEDLPDALLVVDASLCVLDVNPAARRLFGSPQVSLPSPLLELVRSAAVFEAFRAALGGERGADATVTVLGEDGSDRRLEVTARPVPQIPGESGERRPGVPAVVGLIRDVSQREKAETMRRQFVADVSHELRTPVASIRLASETLLGEEMPAEAQRFLQIIERQSRHMEDLVSDLTDLSQIETGAVTLESERREARSLLADVIRDLSAPAAARRVTVTLDAPEGVGLEGDPRRLSQVFRNLVDNAIKFSPEGGEVQVRAHAVADGTEVSVADRGPGIPRADRDKIFQRFYRVDPSRAKTVPGTGLGLAIVKHLLILHGGAITVDSELGRGSTFTVRIPSKATPQPRTQP